MLKFSGRNGNYVKKTKSSRKIRNFLKQMQESCENSSKRLNFEITRLISKWDKDASPIDGLTQNINIDLGTTRRHQTIHRFA